MYLRRDVVLLDVMHVAIRKLEMCALYIIYIVEITSSHFRVPLQERTTLWKIWIHGNSTRASEVPSLFRYVFAAPSRASNVGSILANTCIPSLQLIPTSARIKVQKADREKVFQAIFDC